MREQNRQHVVNSMIALINVEQKKADTHLKMKSPFCTFLTGESSILVFSFSRANEETSKVPAELDLVYSESPWRAARSKMFLSTVSSA